MARPTKANADRRERVIAFRVDAEQLARLTILAADAEFLRVSDYARATALRGQPPGRPAKSVSPAAASLPFEIVDQLRRIGVNLNQLTKLAHFGDLDPVRLNAVLAEIDAILAPIHAAASDRRPGGPP